MKNPPADSAGGTGKREVAALALHKQKEGTSSRHRHQSARDHRSCQRNVVL